MGTVAPLGQGMLHRNAMASTDPLSVLEHNSNLSSKLDTLTGATRVADLKTDASAFKNFGQFVAAAHVAKNLNITGVQELAVREHLQVLHMVLAPQRPINYVVRGHNRTRGILSEKRSGN